MNINVADFLAPSVLARLVHYASVVFISPSVLARLVHYATVVKKSPRTIIDRELNRFMDEEGEYNMQELAMKSRKNQRAKRNLEAATCISSSPRFGTVTDEVTNVKVAVTI